MSTPRPGEEAYFPVEVAVLHRRCKALDCLRWFRPRRRGHVYCDDACRVADSLGIQRRQHRHDRIPCRSARSTRNEATPK